MIKKLITVFALTCLWSLPAIAGTIPISGTIRLANGNLMNGRVRFVLSYGVARDTTNSNLVVAQVVEFPVANGALPSSARITPNDVLQPANTFYTAQYLSAAGTAIAQNVFYIQGSTFNIGAATPTPLTTSNISFGSFTGLDNVTSKKINNVRFCDQFAGANAGAKIAACIADLPSTGGVANAVGLEGSQTITASPFASVTKPVTLLFGAGTYTITGAVWVVPGGTQIIGLDPTATILQWNGSGYLIDVNDEATLRDNVVIRDLRINVSSSGTGGIRIGDRTATFADKHHEWLIEDVGIYGQLAANTIGLDITDLANSTIIRTQVNNFAQNVKLTSFHQNSVINLTTNHSNVDGLIIDHSQPGAVAGGEGGTTFNNTVIEGIDCGNGVNLREVQDVTFNGLFIETGTVCGTPPIPLRINSLVGATFNRIEVSNTGWGDMLHSTDSFNIRINSFRLNNLNTGSLTSTVTYTSSALGSSTNYTTWASRTNFGGIRCSSCSYQINLALRGKEGVTIDGDDKFPGSVSNGQLPLSGVTDLWSKSLINRQGIANVSDTDFVLDAFHGQNHYSSDGLATIVADANASKGAAIRGSNNTFFGFEFLYPSEITLGTYELIVRGKISAGTVAPGFGLDTVNAAGTVTTTRFNGSWSGNWTTSYQVFSMRFTLTSTYMSTDVKARIYVAVTPGAGQTFSIDYMILRPAENDTYCQVYVAPDGQARDATGGVVNGGRVSCASAIPAAGQYEKGDFVRNLNPAGDHSTTPASSGMVDVAGWLRKTSGTSHTDGTDWYAVTTPTKTLVGNASLDFPAVAANACEELTMTVTGAVSASGFANIVTLGLPQGLASVAGLQFTGYVSAANTVTVRACNVTTGASSNPASAVVVAKVEIY